MYWESWRRRRISLIVAPILAAGMLSGVLAGEVKSQSASPAPLDAAFAKMMSQPNNADAALNYARIAAANGQPRAAIAALERVLRANPGLDNIRLELASLYMAVGSPAVAGIYARQALASPQIPPQVASRARDLLAQAEKGTSRSLLQANIFVGLQHDSDANQASTYGLVGVYSPIFGPVLVPTPIKGEPDGSSVINAQINHIYDLGLQREAAWETNASLFDQRFFNISHNYDLTVLQADTGPRFGVGNIGGAAVSVRPFSSTAWIGYGGSTYATLYGGGLSAELRTSAWQVALTGIGRFGNYEDSSFRPQTRQYTGAELSLSMSASYSIDATASASGTFLYYQANARLDDYSRQGPGVNLAFTKDLVVLHRNVELIARAGVQRLRYGGPNPQINPFAAQVDTQWAAGLSITVPIVRSLAAVAQYSYFQNNSSYAVYRFDDNAFTLGLRVGL